MVVVPFIRRVIPHPATPKVCLGHQPKLLKQFQGTLDGGDVNIGILSHYLGIDFLSADVVVTIFNS